MPAPTLEIRTFCIALLLAFGGWSPLALNRLLFEKHELQPTPAGLRAILPLNDRRAMHVARVLQLRDGDTVRAGVLDGLMYNNASIRWIWPDHYQAGWLEKDERSLRPERLQLEDIIQALKKQPVLPDSLEICFSEASPSISKPQVDLLLAPPPLDRLKRLLTEVTQLGVGTVVLCKARGLDKRLFGTAWIKEPSRLRDCLVQGLAQSGDTSVPRLIVTRHLQPFLQSSDFKQLSEKSMCFRVTIDEADAFNIPSSLPQAVPRILLAVGPDKGWCPATETTSLDEAGFSTLGIGSRLSTPELKTCSAIAIASAMIRRWTKVGAS